MKQLPPLDCESWIDNYGDALFHFAAARVKDRQMAEDLVQDTFLAALQSKERYQGRSSEKAWLFSILKHKIIDHYRRKKNIVNVNDYIEDPDSVDVFFNAKGGWQTRPNHWSRNPAEAHENKEFLDHFYRCLSGLPQRTADVFILREIDGLSTGEICERNGITENNCGVILYRARMLLRKCLESTGFGQIGGGPKA